MVISYRFAHETVFWIICNEFIFLWMQYEITILHVLMHVRQICATNINSCDYSWSFSTLTSLLLCLLSPKSVHIHNWGLWCSHLRDGTFAGTMEHVWPTTDTGFIRNWNLVTRIKVHCIKHTAQPWLLPSGVLSEGLPLITTQLQEEMLEVRYWQVRWWCLKLASLLVWGYTQTPSDEQAAALPSSTDAAAHHIHAHAFHWPFIRYGIEAM